MYNKMKEIVIYTTEVCPYCIRAKNLLKKKGVAFKEVRLDQTPDLVDDVVRKSGGRKTVPQIFIGDNHIGGCDELYALDRDGKLDPMLEGI